MADEFSTSTGASGARYKYKVHPLDPDWNEVGANYIFARRNQSGGFTALYFGKTGNLKERMSGHEKWPCVRREGVTHILAHVNKDEKARLKEEKDLRDSGNTPCNDQ